MYGNTITASAGFLLASKGNPSWSVLASMAVGIALVMASGCVFNNLLDRRIDAIMHRTRQRSTVTGAIGSPKATVYGLILGVAGIIILATSTNPLTVGLAAGGFIIYVGVYGFFKRRSVYGTLIGSLAGAVPPVVGYCSVTNHIDGGALLLFIVLALWQMPHFYAIAMYRYDDYKAANLPVLPVKKGMKAAKFQILLYIVGFIFATASLSLAGYTGYSFAIVMMLIGLAWLATGLWTLRTLSSTKWGRLMFRTSLLVIAVLSGMLSVGAIMP